MNKNKTKLGLSSCVLIVVGGCVGSAIFSLSGLTIYSAGPAAILSWFFAGVINMFFGMQVAELAVRYPKSGGVFLFPKFALIQKNPKAANLLAFICAWGFVICSVVAIAFAAICIFFFLSVVFEMPAWCEVVIPLVFCAFAVVMTLNKVTNLGKFSTVFLIALLVSIFTYVLVAVFGGTFNAGNFVPFFTQGSDGTWGWLLSVPVAVVAYGACTSICYMVSDVKNPNKTVPLSLIIGLLVVIILYVLMIFATVGNLNVSTLLDPNNSDLVYMPMIAATTTSGLLQYPWLTYVVSFAALFALVVNIVIMTSIASGAVATISENKLFPEFLSKRSKNSSPLTATLLVGTCVAILSLFKDGLEQIVTLGAVLNIIVVIIICVSLIFSRKNNVAKTNTQDNSQYRAPFGNALPIITIIVMIICRLPDIMTYNISLLLFTLGVYVVGLAIYIFFYRKNIME